MTDRLPVGEAIDRAAKLVTRNRSAFVQVDELSAGLLDARFEVVAEDGALELRAERAEGDFRRTLLGRQTSCVGRTKELAALSAVYTDCINEGTSQVALVTGAAARANRASGTSFCECSNSAMTRRTSGSRAATR